MMQRLLPRSIDNRYAGSTAALWLLGLVLVTRSAQSLSILVDGPAIITGADGIPLDTYAPVAAGTVVATVALAGMARLVLCLLGFLILARYRAAAGLMFLALIVEHLGRMLVLQIYPIVRTGSPPGPVVNQALFACMVLGLALALWRRDGGGDRRGA